MRSLLFVQEFGEQGWRLFWFRLVRVRITTTNQVITQTKMTHLVGASSWFHLCINASEQWRTVRRRGQSLERGRPARTCPHRSLSTYNRMYPLNLEGHLSSAWHFSEVPGTFPQISQVPGTFRKCQALSPRLLRGYAVSVQKQLRTFEPILRGDSPQDSEVILERDRSRMGARAPQAYPSASASCSSASPPSSAASRLDSSALVKPRASLARVDGPRYSSSSDSSYSPIAAGTSSSGS